MQDVPCAHCGSPADPKADFCHGCGRVVCLACVDKHDHSGTDGRHGGFPRVNGGSKPREVSR